MAKCTPLVARPPRTSLVHAIGIRPPELAECTPLVPDLPALAQCTPLVLDLPALAQCTPLVPDLPAPAQCTPSVPHLQNQPSARHWVTDIFTLAQCRLLFRLTYLHQSSAGQSSARLPQSSPVHATGLPVTFVRPMHVTGPTETSTITQCMPLHGPPDLLTLTQCTPVHGPLPVHLYTLTQCKPLHGSLDLSEAGKLNRNASVFVSPDNIMFIKIGQEYVRRQSHCFEK